MGLGAYAQTAEKHAGDRWIEIDLFWFRHSDIKGSAEAFMDRYHSLFEGIDGWKGVAVNTGWIMDFILEWDGNLDSRFPTPEGMTRHPMVDNPGLILGDTEARSRIHKERFEKAHKPEPVEYGEWTYRDIKNLFAEIRKVAAKKYNIKDLRVGTLTLGWTFAYGGPTSTFWGRHPNAMYAKYGEGDLSTEAFDRDWGGKKFNDSYGQWGFPNYRAKLHADDVHYAAYPDGIPEGLPFNVFYGKQWGHLSKAVGIDAIVLRDGYLGVGVYRRIGPFGKKPSPAPAEVKSWSDATADFVKQVKLGNPDALVIGYSSAASAIGDYRVNCLDLETIAKEGYLDAWIDQTWAGAWNEFGIRKTTPWCSVMKGWTYQLAYILGHAAALSGSDVRHYFIAESRDAWESQDVIYPAPERVRWEIWAYSHASVKTPEGLEPLDGAYMACCSKGDKLLSEWNVGFLEENLNAAFDDAAEMKEIYGPTLVYNRSGMAWQNEHKPDSFVKEWIDEQFGTVMKWSVPVMSITRMEYFDKVSSDMFVFQAPNHLTASEKTVLTDYINSGRPAVVTGSPAGGIDPDIAKIIGVSTTYSKPVSIEYIGTINGRTSGIYKNLPNTFPLFHPYTWNKTDKSNEVIYTVRQSPALIYNGDKNILFWDAPELAINIPQGQNFGRSLDQLIGSPVPWTLAARKINEMSQANGSVSVEYIDPYRPVNFCMWRLENGSCKILLGNLEEGLEHTGKQDREIVLRLPESITGNETIHFTELWRPGMFLSTDNRIPVDLHPSESRMIILENK